MIFAEHLQHEKVAGTHRLDAAGDSEITDEDDSCSQSPPERRLMRES